MTIITRRRRIDNMLIFGYKHHTSARGVPSMEVKRSNVRDALRSRVSAERAQEIMMILEPLFLMCEQNRFFYGHADLVPQDIHATIEFLTKRPCVGVEYIGKSMIPQRLITCLQDTNFVVRLRRSLDMRLCKVLGDTNRANLYFDLRIGFGERLLHELPFNLWNQLWETVRCWIFCEVAGSLFEKEAVALEQIVRLLSGGYIVFDVKPTDPAIAFIVNQETSPPNQRYRSR
jgi:hypothetical protein